MIRFVCALGAVVVIQGCFTPVVDESSVQDALSEDSLGFGVGGCCKDCGSDSQPCGDSCIALDKTCHKGPGCAC